MSVGISHIYASEVTVFQIVGKSYEIRRNRIIWPTIWSKYVALKEVSDLVNQVYGNLITIFLMSSLLYYSITIGRFFVHISNPAWNILWTVMYGSMDVLIFWLMVDIPNLVRTCFELLGLFFRIFFYENCLKIFFFSNLCAKQMGDLRKWLALPKNRRQVPSDDLVYILSDLERVPVAVKGTTFPVTYNLLAHVSTNLQN